jgi:hypothetical protein
VLGTVLFIMTAKEQAKELYVKFFRTTPQPYYNENHGTLKFETWDSNWTHKMAKEQALICIEYILKSIFTHENSYEFWSEVKTELEALS